MQTTSSHTDRLGHSVQIGDQVRIVAVDIDPDIDDEDRDMFEHMVGSTCEIERFDEQDLAWVTMWWATLDGNLTTSVGLAPHQMEKVAPVPGAE
jgi:hypothetical protein